MPVVLVKSKIFSKKDIELIYPFLLERINEVEHILPTSRIRWSGHPYRNAETMRPAFVKASTDAIDGKITVKDYINYVRIIFISSSLSPSDSEFYSEIKEKRQLAEYIEANKNEV